jgi:hypothetical protein
MVTKMKFAHERVWSMADDRELTVLAERKRLDAIADQLGRPPKSILRKAVRFGLKIKGREAKK